MLTMPADMVEALSYAHWQTITCQPHMLDAYGDPVPSGDPLLVVGGNIAQDTEPPVRRAATFTVAVPALSTAAETQALGEALVAGGVLLQMTWGVRLMDGRSFSVPIGNLRTESAEWASEEGTVRITAYDLGQAVADARFVAPRPMSSMTKRDAIATLLEEVAGEVTFGDDISTAALYPVTWDTERDTAVTELATALGCWWWWDAAGGWRVEEVPTPTSDPQAADWVVPAHIGIVTDTGSASREGVWNAVAVTGKTPDTETDPTPFAVAYDDDPASPTRWDGPFGNKPRFYSSPILTTNAQCLSAGESLLSRSRGITRGLTFSTPVHPGLEPGDTIAFASGTPAGVFVIDTIDLPLDANPMKMTARQVAT